MLVGGIGGLLRLGGLPGRLEGDHAGNLIVLEVAPAGKDHRRIGGMRGSRQRLDVCVGVHDRLRSRFSDHAAVHAVGHDHVHAGDGILAILQRIGGSIHGVMRAPGSGVGRVAGHGLGGAVAPAVAVLVNPGVKVVTLTGRVGGQRGVLALGHLLAEHDVVFLGAVQEHDGVELRPLGGIGGVGRHRLGHGRLPAVEAVALAGGLGRGGGRVPGQQAGGGLVVEDHRVLHAVGVGDGVGGVSGQQVERVEEDGFFPLGHVSDITRHRVAPCRAPLYELPTLRGGDIRVVVLRSRRIFLQVAIDLVSKQGAVLAVHVDDGVETDDLHIGLDALAGGLLGPDHHVDGGRGFIGGNRQQASVLINLCFTAVIALNGILHAHDGVGGVGAVLGLGSGQHAGGLVAVKDRLDGGVLLRAADQVQRQGAAVRLCLFTFSNGAGGPDHDVLVEDLVGADVEHTIFVDPGAVGLLVLHVPCELRLLDRVAHIGEALNHGHVHTVDVDGGALGGHGHGMVHVEGGRYRDFAPDALRGGGRVGGAHLEHVGRDAVGGVAVFRRDFDVHGVGGRVLERAAVQALAPIDLRGVLVRRVVCHGGHGARHGTRHAGDVELGDGQLAGGGEGEIKHVARLGELRGRRAVDLHGGVVPAQSMVGIEGKARNIGGLGLEMALGIQHGQRAGRLVKPGDAAVADLDGLVVDHAGAGDGHLRRLARHGRRDVDAGVHRRVLRHRRGDGGMAVGRFGGLLGGVVVRRGIRHVGNQRDLLAVPRGVDGQRGVGAHLLAVHPPAVANPAGYGGRGPRVERGDQRIAHLRRGLGRVGVGALVDDAHARNRAVGAHGAGGGADGLTRVGIRGDGLDADGLAHVRGLDLILAGHIGMRLGADRPDIGDLAAGAQAVQRVGGEVHGDGFPDHGAGVVERHGGDDLVADDGVAQRAVDIVHAAFRVKGADPVDARAAHAHLDAVADSRFGHGDIGPVQVEGGFHTGGGVDHDPLIGGGGGGGGDHGGAAVARGEGVVAQRGGGNIGALHQTIGGSGGAARVGRDALHPQADLLAQVVGGDLVAGGGSHHVAIGHPYAVDGRAGGGHDGAEHLAHHDGAVLDAQIDGEHFRAAAHLAGGRADGHAAEGVNTVDLELNQLADVALLHGIGRLGAHLNAAHAPAVADRGRGGLEHGGQGIPHEGLRPVERYLGHLAAGNHRVGGVLPGAVVYAGARDRQGDGLADVVVEHAQRGAVALLHAVHLPAVGHRRIRRGDDSLKHVVHDGRRIIDAHGLHHLGRRRRRRRDGDITAHHIAAHTADGNIVPLVAIGKNGHGRAGAVELNAFPVRRGAQPNAQAVVADHGAGAHAAALTAAAGAGAAGAEYEELVHHPAHGFTDADLRPLGAALLHDDRRAYVVFCHDAIGLAGAFAHTYPIAVFAGDHRILLRRGDRGHQSHQRQGNQQDA